MSPDIVLVGFQCRALLTTSFLQTYNPKMRYALLRPCEKWVNLSLSSTSVGKIDCIAIYMTEVKQIHRKYSLTGEKIEKFKHSMIEEINYLL